MFEEREEVVYCCSNYSYVTQCIEMFVVVTLLISFIH